VKTADKPQANGGDGDDAAGAADPKIAMQANLIALEEKIREVTKKF
jgi:hypothetical protein